MKSFLVVDDSKVIRKVARHILESLQMSVSEACDGRDALTQCEAAIPDVVLLDWNMPVMSGMEFLEALSQREMDARPKIIFCTTERSEEHTSELQSLMRISYAVFCLKKKTNKSKKTRRRN